jgi:hypothetical protein
MSAATIYPKASAVKVSAILLALVVGLTVVGLPVSACKLPEGVMSEKAATEASVGFLDFSRGLQEQHTSIEPLLEQVTCRPGSRCQAMRVYPDGALYHEDQRDPHAPGWSYLTQVKAEGLATLAAIFREACAQAAPPRRSGNDAGSVTYRWKSGDCAREVTITGVSYDGYEALRGVMEAVNGNLAPRR